LRRIAHDRTSSACRPPANRTPGIVAQAIANVRIHRTESASFLKPSIAAPAIGRIRKASSPAPMF
jgi:hypothetical protein